MSTKIRKARKLAGIKFTPKAPKTATPVEERSFVTAPVHRSGNDEGKKYGTQRSPRRVAKFIASGGIK